MTRPLSCADAVSGAKTDNVITDNAIKHFKGTIDFKKGCKKARRKE